MAKAELPDLILMDLSMPAVDGWRATELLKSDPETREIPIIVVSAHAMASERERAERAGCDAFVTKPFDVADLLGLIEKFLQQGARR